MVCSSRARLPFTAVNRHVPIACHRGGVRRGVAVLQVP